ncbi:MAG: type IV toxin-antitoxin system AbiEi family antitoxin domain-containing protein [Betaproteobacteria bacterium]|nr:type IV toxin-antitoxin system AbiEi family antitoxin domain-containing protein [Betaproteobacteria bacterium]
MRITEVLRAISLVERRNYGAITAADVATQLGISRQSAHSWLSKLTAKGYLERSGKGRGTYYTRIVLQKESGNR